jgi:NAD(P)-dependent dehydrogenase (short-subunit alcohol dehydrogenase family)
VTRKVDRFAGKECLVTGGGSGIGLETARTFAREGGTVTIWDLDEAAAKAAVEDLDSSSGQEHRWYALDLSHADEVQSAATQLRAAAPKTDVLVNCAAIAAPGPITGPFLQMPESQWRPLIEVNFVAHVRVLQAVAPGMLDLDEGASIVNVISDSYLGHDRQLAMYGAGKAALASLTRTLARELGSHNVRVNGVSPSATATPSTGEWLAKYEDRIVKMYPLGRLGSPQDQANAIAFMASDESAWITGQILSVNGGFI